MCTYQRWHHWNGSVGVWGIWVLGVCREVYGTTGVKSEGTLHGTILINDVCAPHNSCRRVFGPCMGVVKLGYLSWRAGLSCRTGSHMCGCWYSPMFLLNEGSFTHMYIASLVFLVTPWGSLLTMVKHSGLSRCPIELLWWWIGDRALRYSLNLSPNVLPDSPIYSSGQLVCGHLNL